MKKTFYKRSDRRKNRQKAGSRAAVRCGRVLLLFMILAVWLAVPLVQPRGAVFAYENGYDITHIDMDITVREDNTYDIVETIDVRYEEGAGKHGIIRSIPTDNTIYREDGSIGHTKAKVSDLTVDAPYTVSEEWGDVRIRIGSADRVVEGDVRYVISYTYDIGRDILRGADEFYFNIVGTRWDTTVESVSFAVHFPKEFRYDEQTLGFTHGYAHSSNYEDVIYNVEDNTVYGRFESPLEAYQGLTMRLLLPEGYFVRSGGVIEKAACGFLGFPLLAFFFTAFVYFTRMRNKKPAEPVEFYPPDGLSPLWVGYYYDGRVDTKDITTMLIWLASKGYLKIYERGPEDYDIILLQDYYPEEDKQAYTFFDGLRRLAKEDPGTGQIIVTKKDLEKKFYKTVDKIRSSMNTKTNKKKYLVSTGPVKGLTMLLGCLSIVLSLFSAVYFAEYDAFSALLVTAVPAVVLAVLMPMLHMNSKTENSLLVRVVLLIFLAAITIVFLAFYLAIGSDGLFDWSLWQTKLAAAGIVLGALTIALSLSMRKRTEKANEMLGRIRGFKRFLETAEKPRLEMLVNESPSYFYDILPYTYVLGITSLWIRRFDGIAMGRPDWYMTGTGGTYYSAADDISRTMDGISRDMTSAPASSGGGGYSSSSGGGGWSSSGSSGGGSSGGGSGGGGGSSW